MIIEKNSWHTFRERYPVIAGKILKFGSALYEQGADSAKDSPEMKAFTALIHEAPRDVQLMLGITEHPVTERALLSAIFLNGSSLLLEYVRHGSC